MAKKQITREALLLKVGGKLRKIRKKKDLTGEELAKMVGMTKPGISRIETGGINVSLEQLSKICFALDISLQDLFKGFK